MEEFLYCLMNGDMVVRKSYMTTKAADKARNQLRNDSGLYWIKQKDIGRLNNHVFEEELSSDKSECSVKCDPSDNASEFYARCGIESDTDILEIFDSQTPDDGELE